MLFGCELNPRSMASLERSQLLVHSSCDWSRGKGHAHAPTAVLGVISGKDSAAKSLVPYLPPDHLRTGVVQTLYRFCTKLFAYFFPDECD